MQFDLLSKFLKPMNRLCGILKRVANLIISFIEDCNLEFYTIWISKVDLDLEGSKND